MWVGGVADSQTRSKPLKKKNHPKNRLLWPEFHPLFSQKKFLTRNSNKISKFSPPTQHSGGSLAHCSPGELLMAIRRSLHGEAIGVWGGDARLAGLIAMEVNGDDDLLKFWEQTMKFPGKFNIWCWTVKMASFSYFGFFVWLFVITFSWCM